MIEGLNLILVVFLVQKLNNFLKEPSQRKIKFSASAFGKTAAYKNRTDARLQKRAARDALAVFRSAEIFKRAAAFIPATQI